MDHKTEQRLSTERNIWMATVRPNGRPHLVPIWFVWYENKIVIGMQPGSVKANNLARNAHIALALEDGSEVVICEGTAVILNSPYPDPLMALFHEKYGWDMIKDKVHNLFYQITPRKWLTWTGSDAEDT